MKNFINDLDKSMREMGVSDMSIGKSVKKYVKKFYFRVKKIDIIFNNFKETEFEIYLNSLKNIEKSNTSKLVEEFINTFADIKKQKFQ